METVLPIIDLSVFLNGSPSERQQVSSDLITACRKYGFAYIKNYTLPERSLNEAFSWSHKFFTMTESEKLTAPHPPGFTHHRGYLPIGQEKAKDSNAGTGFLEPSLDSSIIPDMKETFDTGHPDNPAQPNIWPPPEVIPGFQSFMKTFFTECHQAAMIIVRCLSFGMNLPEDFFTSKCSSNQNQLRLLRYPSIPVDDFSPSSITPTTTTTDKPSSTGTKKTRFGAHADWSFFTILFQDECGGLEIEDPEHPGGYIPVKPIPETLVINVGDVLKRWSNDELKSPIHRVGPPPPSPPLTPPEDDVHESEVKVEGEKKWNKSKEKTLSKERYSIPYFIALDADVVIDTLPMFVSEKNPKKYKPISVADYLMAKSQGLEV